jgi:Domain of unknown function (DUF6265)
MSICLAFAAWMPPEKFSWKVYEQLARSLGGQWEMATSRGKLLEQWELPSKVAVAGKSFKIRNTDTMLMETLEVRYNNQGITYNSLVSGQNGGEAVAFALVSADSGRYVFENLMHDFPQRIIYHFVHQDSIHARIEGMMKDQPRSSDYYYRRCKP